MIQHKQKKRRFVVVQPLAAVRNGDTLVVPKRDRLVRSVADTCQIADALLARGVKRTGGKGYCAD